MILTNKLDLPQPFVDAATNDHEYTEGRYSVTELLGETCEAMLDCDECLRADGSHKERRRLSAENAKLRELVRDMCKAFIHGPCYRWCEHMPEPCNGDKCQYVRRMHELGVDA